MHIMLDLETMGTGPDAAILSIGAARFDPTADGVDATFEVNVSLGSCLGRGMSVSAGTIEWWLHPDRAEARSALQARETVDLYYALDGFRQWFGATSVPVWGNGAAFDNVILRTAYEKCGLPVPWQFWHDRCYRTWKAMYPDVTIDRVGTHHNALHDAVTQAQHLQKIIRAHGIVVR